MSDREPMHVREHPMAGDVIEIVEKLTDPDTQELFNHESMLRVVAVHEERVWFKEYGKGHSLVGLSQWRERLGKSLRSTVVRGGDHDAPF